MSVWGKWSKCSVTCGPNEHAGIRVRLRHVEIEAEHGGRICGRRAKKQSEQCIHCSMHKKLKETEETKVQQQEGDCIPLCPSIY